MMTKLSTTVKVIVSVMVVAAVVTACCESSKQQSESKRSLRVGKERKLESPFAIPILTSSPGSTFSPFSASYPGSTSSPGSAFSLPSFDATSFTAGLTSLPTATGDNAGGVLGVGFGDSVAMQTFFGTVAAGGSGGGMSKSMAGGSIKPLFDDNGDAIFQVTSFGANSGNTASGFGSGLVGPDMSGDFSGNLLSFGQPVGTDEDEESP
jgi:hypothetical protein